MQFFMIKDKETMLISDELVSAECCQCSVKILHQNQTGKRGSNHTSAPKRTKLKDKISTLKVLKYHLVQIGC